MARHDDVVEDAEREVGQEYFWGPMPASLYEWATTPALDQAVLGRDAEHPGNCFEFPMLLAIRRGYLGREAVRRIIGHTIDARGDAKAKAFAESWSTALWKDWKALGSVWRPRRGDLVFFEAAIGGVLNHVALATGKTSLIGHAEVITFGEGRERPGQARVNKSSIEFLFNDTAHVGHTNVKFLCPSWT